MDRVVCFEDSLDARLNSTLKSRCRVALSDLCLDLGKPRRRNSAVAVVEVAVEGTHFGPNGLLSGNGADRIVEDLTGRLRPAG